MSSYGLFADFRCPKVSKGERREAGIQWIQPPKAVSDRSFRQTTSGAHGSANRADCLPRGKPFGAPAGAYLLPRGLTRRLRRGRWGCRPEGGQYFLSKRKKVPKKARGTATPGKRLLLPILTAGLAMSRAAELASLRLPSCALGARLFPPSKWAGLFSSAAYRRSAPPQAALGRLKWRRLGCSDAAEMVSQRRKTGLFFCGWRYPYINSTAWDTSKRLGYFCNKKSQRGLLSTLTFLCEP